LTIAGLECPSSLANGEDGTCLPRIGGALSFGGSRRSIALLRASALSGVNGKCPSFSTLAVPGPKSIDAAGVSGRDVGARRTAGVPGR